MCNCLSRITYSSEIKDFESSHNIQFLTCSILTMNKVVRSKGPAIFACFDDINNSRFQVYYYSTRNIPEYRVTHVII